MDFVGHFPSGEYLLVLIDDYSRFPEAEILPSLLANVVISRLNMIFARQRYPTIVKTNNGPPFQGQDFKDFRSITPLWPEANGEGIFLAPLWKGLTGNPRLPNFLRQYRATPHSITKISLFEACTGRKLNIGQPDTLKNPAARPTHDRIAGNDIKGKEIMKWYADRNKKTKTKPSPLCLGDPVLIKHKRQNKLSPPYNPKQYTVTKKKSRMETLQRGDHQVTRNSSLIKRVGLYC